MKKQKFEIGDFIFCEKGKLHSTTAMIIATNPSNNFSNASQDIIKNCYPTVYYVLLSNGEVEGPLFQSEICQTL